MTTPTTPKSSLTIITIAIAKIFEAIAMWYTNNKAVREDKKDLKYDAKLHDAIRRGDTVKVGELIKKAKKYKALTHDRSQKKSK